MTAEELQAIRDRESKATKGPWVASRMEDPLEFIVTSATAEPGSNGICSMWCSGWLSGNIKPDDGDWQFVAHAREDIPALLAEIDRLQGELERRGSA